MADTYTCLHDPACSTRGMPGNAKAHSVRCHQANSGLRASPVYADVQAERERAHAKHGPHSMESYPAGAFIRYTILAEEVGEIAKEFNEAEARGGQHTLDLDRVRREALQVAAMAIAWVDAIAREDSP